jgi:hypothetical protein
MEVLSEGELTPADLAAGLLDERRVAGVRDITSDGGAT